MGRLVHTGLSSSSLVAHVLHYSPSPHANSFIIGTAVIKTNTLSLVKVDFVGPGRTLRRPESEFLSPGLSWTRRIPGQVILMIMMFLVRLELECAGESDRARSNNSDFDDDFNLFL